jgi:hypothetical protein
MASKKKTLAYRTIQYYVKCGIYPVVSRIFAEMVLNPQEV